MSYVIYTRSGCVHCDTAKKLLTKNNIPFDEKDIDRYKQALLASHPTLKSLPVIFHDGELISLSDLQKQLGGIK